MGKTVVGAGAAMSAELAVTTAAASAEADAEVETEPVCISIYIHMNSKIRVRVLNPPLIIGSRPDFEITPFPTSYRSQGLVSDIRISAMSYLESRSPRSHFFADARRCVSWLPCSPMLCVLAMLT